MVRLAVEQVANTFELPVGQAEGSMERLFGDARQTVESRSAIGNLVFSGRSPSSGR
jgi:hypothetical protein